ncbi:MAG: hypothetical protein MRJ68_13155 [Nitrospira sp.]|nr:hypothetical protein [Nitrospira sp.]
MTKMDFLQAEGQRIDKAQELAGQEETSTGSSGLAEAETQHRGMLSEFQQTKQAELSTLETKAASLAQEVTKADQRPGCRSWWRRSMGWCSNWPSIRLGES